LTKTGINIDVTLGYLVQGAIAVRRDFKPSDDGLKNWSWYGGGKQEKNQEVPPK
jgi:hypothetical protein